MKVKMTIKIPKKKAQKRKNDNKSGTPANKKRKLNNDNKLSKEQSAFLDEIKNVCKKYGIDTKGTDEDLFNKCIEYLKEQDSTDDDDDDDVESESESDASVSDAEDDNGDETDDSEYSDKNSKNKKQPKKSNKKDDNAHKEEKEKRKKIDEELISCTVQQLKDMLRHNAMRLSGNKGDLIARIVDFKMYGCLPKCPSCGGGILQVKYPTRFGHGGQGSWSCPGYHDDEDFIHCSFKTKDKQEREKWKDL